MIPLLPVFAVAVAVGLWLSRKTEPSGAGDEPEEVSVPNDADKGSGVWTGPRNERLARSFTLDEFLRNGAGVDLQPSNDQVRNLRNLAAALQRVRDRIAQAQGKDVPIRITSGLRNDAVIASMKSRGYSPAASSWHNIGAAADIAAPGFNSAALLAVIQAELSDFDQAIAYSPSQGGHVHLGYAPSLRARKQVLYKVDPGKKYLTGSEGYTALLKSFTTK